MRLAHLESQGFVECRAKWDFIQHSAVDASEGNYSALSARLNCLSQYDGAIERKLQPLLGVVIRRRDSGPVRFETNGIDASVRTASGRHPLEFFNEVVDFFV